MLYLCVARDLPVDNPQPWEVTVPLKEQILNHIQISNRTIQYRNKESQYQFFKSIQYKYDVDQYLPMFWYLLLYVFLHDL